MYSLLYLLGILTFVVLCGALQRKFFPHTLVNGYMDINKLEEICPGIFKNKSGEKK